jgi:hypothetical protein
VKPGLPRRLRVRGVGLWNGQISVGSVQRSCTIANASFQDIFPEANTSLSVYANEASSYASKLASSAKSTVSDQLNSLPDMSMLLDEQVSKLPELTNSLRDNASDAFSAVSDMARAVVGASQDALQEAMPRVSAQVAEVSETLSTGSLDAILASPPTLTAGVITAVALVSLVGFAAGSSSSSSSSDFGAASRSRESSSGSSQARAAPFSQSTTPVSESSLRTQSVSIGQAQSSTREGAAVSMAAAPTRAAVATVEPPFSTRAVANAATNGAVHNAAEANFSAYTQETNESNKEPVLPVVVGDGNADTDGSLKRAPDGDSKTESSAEAGTNATGKVATAAMAEPVVESVTASEVPAAAVDTSPGVSGQPAEKVAPVTTASDVLDAELEQVTGAVADEVKRGVCLLSFVYRLLRDALCGTGASIHATMHAASCSAGFTSV